MPNQRYVYFYHGFQLSADAKLRMDIHGVANLSFKIYSAESMRKFRELIAADKPIEVIGSPLVIDADKLIIDSLTPLGEHVE